MRAMIAHRGFGLCVAYNPSFAVSWARGTRLGPYEILALLGAGGMDEVYRAHDPRLGREVATNVLPAGLSADPDRLRRFDQEARAAAALNHPNILAVYDLGTHDGAPYVVSERDLSALHRQSLTALRRSREACAPFQ